MWAHARVVTSFDLPYPTNPRQDSLRRLLEMHNDLDSALGQYKEYKDTHGIPSGGGGGGGGGGGDGSGPGDRAKDAMLAGVVADLTSLTSKSLTMRSALCHIFNLRTIEDFFDVISIYFGLCQSRVLRCRRAQLTRLRQKIQRPRLACLSRPTGGSKCRSQEQGHKTAWQRSRRWATDAT